MHVRASRGEVHLGWIDTNIAGTYIHLSAT